VDDALARRARHYLTESSGTSYAAPLFAGMMALVNDERLAMNKTTVGFVSPALYALHRSDGAESVFNDIKEGSSKCPNAKMCGAMVGCCKHGFRAGKGWDPLTGLGSVDFQRLRDELVRLP
jgi:tripeptidyl-peptidase-1